MLGAYQGIEAHRALEERIASCDVGKRVAVLQVDRGIHVVELQMAVLQVVDDGVGIESCAR